MRKTGREKEALQPGTEWSVSEGKPRGTDGVLRSLIRASLPLSSHQSLQKRGEFG